jgi:hypothetical protein
MTTVLAFQESLTSWIEPDVTPFALPGRLPLGFPATFSNRMHDLARHPEISARALEHLYFDLVLCPQLHASMRRMQPGSTFTTDAACGEAIFLDPKFSWAEHIDERLGHRWRECLIRHGDEGWLSQAVALLSSFRVLAEHLH